MNWATEKQIWFINKLLKEKTSVAKKDRDNYYIIIGERSYRMSKNHKSGIMGPTANMARMIIDALLKNEFRIEAA